MRKIKITTGIIFLLIYCMLLFFSGYYFFECATMEGHIILFLLIGILCFLGRVHIIKKKLYIAVILFGNALLTQMLTGFDIIQVILVFLLLFEAAFISSMITFDEFRIGYVNCLIAIAIVSLVGNILFIIVPHILTYFPILTNSVGRIGYFMGFSCVSSFRHTGAYRNQGIFWEPGAYQIFLCLAYLFELYSESERKSCRKWVLGLLLISIASTVSTTGIIVAMALVVLTISRAKGSASMIKIGITLFFITIIAIQFLPKLSGFWRYTLITKIDQILHYQRGVTNEASSRMDSVIYPLLAYVRSPILGIGTTGYSELGKIVGHTMFTCTPINWIVTYGIGWAAIYYQGLFSCFKKLTKNNFEAILGLLIVCLSLFSETLTINIIFAILVFYGFGSKKKFKKEVGYISNEGS